MTEFRASLSRCRSASLLRTRSSSRLYPLARTASVPSLTPSFKPYYESYLSSTCPVRRYQRDRTLEYYRDLSQYRHCTTYASKYYPRYFLNTDYIRSHSYYWGDLGNYYPQYRSNLHDYGSNRYIAGFYSNYHKPYSDHLLYSAYSRPYYDSPYHRFSYRYRSYYY